MTREQFISLFFIALLIFVVYEIFLIFGPFFHSIFWAAILAFGFYPIYDRLKKVLKTHEIVAALIMTVLIFLVVIPPVVLLVINITDQAIELYLAVSGYIQSGGLEKLINDTRALPFVQSLEAQIGRWEPLNQNISTWVLTGARNLGNFTATQVGLLTKNLFFVILNVFLVAILLFIFLKDGGKIYQFVYDIAPLDKDTKKPVFGQINETFSAVIRGQLLTSLTQAILAGNIFWILGIPASILFGMATFLAALIPVAGPSVIWLPLTIYLFVQQAYVKAIVLFLFG
ncbi:MAG TPA: AI-2E family transporter, partial [bacterium]|nr:AI-2E family transporter [bacterium]